ncbi:MAG: asparaginase [Armatimonadetes bacterium]|nr:asparaginase [Armatimonadota bacterium]
MPLAEVTRGSLVESVHFGHVAVADAEGALIYGYGDPNRLCYLRSSAKPIQALAVVLSGAADKFAFDARELAICCASHHGRPEQVAAVLAVLDKLGLGPEALQCGVHEPLDPEARRQLIAAGREPSPLHNNCSGKHAGMLAVCLAMGWDIADYVKPDHPLQRWHLRNVAQACGVAEKEVVIGIDGCGVPTFGVPLRAIAAAFARLVTGVGLDNDLAAAAERVRQAMWAAPELISAPDGFDSQLLAAGQGALLAKGGAEGLLPVGSIDGLGFAVKVDDGSARAMPPIVTSIGRRLTQFPAAIEERWANLPVRNAHGWQVGVIRPAPALEQWLSALPQVSSDR